jgi:SAM-dependent methyltransferase
MISAPTEPTVQERARLSRGVSDHAIYAMVGRALQDRHPGGGLLLDIGCGTGDLWRHLSDRFTRYVGIDALRYEGFPANEEFIEANIDRPPLPFPDESADVVAAVETIEHLENPRAFFRELRRLIKPGGWVIVTTPNNLSVLSLMTLVMKHRFSAFQDIHYPAHLTSVLEIDLRRMAAECCLTDAAVLYSSQGRIILTPWHYPALLSHIFPRALSDNVLLVGRKPDA